MTESASDRVRREQREQSHTTYHPGGDVSTCPSCGQKWWIAKERQADAMPTPGGRGFAGFVCDDRIGGCGALLDWSPLMVVGHAGDDPAVLRLIEEVVRKPRRQRPSVGGGDV